MRVNPAAVTFLLLALAAAAVAEDGHRRERPLTAEETSILNYMRQSKPVCLERSGKPGPGFAPLFGSVAKRTRLKLLGVWRSKSGRYAVLKRYYSFEGDTAQATLVFDDGRCLFITDATRDPYADTPVRADTGTAMRGVWRIYNLARPWRDGLPDNIKLEIEFRIKTDSTRRYF